MGERNVIKAALLGAGTVGSGVYALAEMLKDEMFQKTGASLEIKRSWYGTQRRTARGSRRRS